MPEQLAARVDTIAPSSVRVQNLDPVRARRAIVQAGAYSEHRFTNVRAGETSPRVEGDRFEVLLETGAGGMLEIGMALIANQPAFRRIP